MIDNNFADLDLADLKGMLRNLDKAIAVKEQQAVVTARRAVEATAREHGFTLADLYGGNIKPSRAAEQKYVNPDDATKTWSGRGRQPHWVRDALASGRALEELAI